MQNGSIHYNLMRHNWLPEKNCTVHTYKLGTLTIEIKFITSHVGPNTSESNLQHKIACEKHSLEKLDLFSELLSQHFTSSVLYTRL